LQNPVPTRVGDVVKAGQGLDTQEKERHVQFMVDLLFPNRESTLKGPRELDLSIDLAQLFELARRERVLVALLQALLDHSKVILAPRQAQTIRERLKECERKSQVALTLLSFVQNSLRRSLVSFTIFKTMDDFPHIPSEDIDLLVPKSNLKEAEVALMGLEIKPYLLERGPLAYLGETKGKRIFHFRLHDQDFEIELYPDLTVLGEQYIPTKMVIDESRTMNFGGFPVLVPSPEHYLGIITMHTLFKHGGLIRLSDFYHASRLLRDKKLDWNQIFESASGNGTLLGLRLFIEIANEFYFDRHKEILLPKIKTIPHTMSPHITEIPYRVPFLTLLLVYLYKIVSDLARLKIGSAIRTWQTCVFKATGRLLYFILSSSGRISALKRWGWYPSTKFYEQ